MMTITMWSLKDSGNLSADNLTDLFTLYKTLLKGEIIDFPVQRYNSGSVMKSFLLKREYEKDKYDNSAVVKIHDEVDVEIGGKLYPIEFTRNKSGRLAMGINLESLDEESLENILQIMLCDYGEVKVVSDTGKTLVKRVNWCLELGYTLHSLNDWKVYLRPAE